MSAGAGRCVLPPLVCDGMRQAMAGLNSLLWDGKAQTGGSVARGVYLIEIVAQDEQGRAARAARMMVVK